MIAQLELRADLEKLLALNIKVYNVNSKNSDDQFNVFGWEGTWCGVEGGVEVVELQSPL